METETSSGKSSKYDGSAFPNEEVIQFPNEDDEGDELEKGTKWKDVAVNKWYRIEDKKDVTSKFGPTTLLTMRDRSNTRVLSSLGVGPLRFSIQTHNVYQVNFTYVPR